MDPVTGAAIISAGSNIFAGHSASQAQKSANKKNMWIYKNSRDIAQENRRTQYQTAVADLKAAGLNPMLAYMQGGATAAPQGVGGSQEAETGQAEGLHTAVSTALQTKRLKQDLDNLEATEKATKEASKKTNQETKLLKLQENSAKLKDRLFRQSLETVQSSSKMSLKKLDPDYEYSQTKKAKRKALQNYYKSSARKDFEANRKKQIDARRNK